MKGELTEDLALSSKSGESDSPVIDFFTSLAICNTVVISVEQKEKVVENIPPRTPGQSLLTPIKKISKDVSKTFKKSMIQTSGVFATINEKLGLSNPAFDSGESNRSRNSTNPARITVIPLKDEGPKTLPRARPMSLSLNLGGSPDSAAAPSTATTTKMVSFDGLVTPSTPLGILTFKR